jgi:hypothetical protein
MANPRQMGLFDGNHPKSTNILIKEKHELLLLTNLIPWPDLIETAMNIRSLRVTVVSGPQHYSLLI